MKIALIGYGKMGRAIERIALSRGHEIVSVIDMDNQSDFDSAAFASADVAIEFTTPGTAVENYRRALSRGVKVVSGTTGWTSALKEVKTLVAEADGTLMWSSNFSIGVNVFMAVNRYLSHLMSALPQYQPSMTEIHHIHKLDHPSGTAITLAEGLIAENNRIERWSETPGGKECLLIEHRREGEVPGTHIVKWNSDVDSITIEHRAKSREGFALGAVMAAEWACGRKGFLTMEMMMNQLFS